MSLQQAEGGPVYSEVVCGQAVIGTTAAALPDVPCRMARLVPAGDVLIGTAASTTYPLPAGQDSGYLPTDNLNRLWAVAASATTLNYLLFR